MTQELTANEPGCGAAPPTFRFASLACITLRCREPPVAAKKQTLAPQKTSPIR